MFSGDWSGSAEVDFVSVPNRLIPHTQFRKLFTWGIRGDEDCGPPPPSPSPVLTTYCSLHIINLQWRGRVGYALHFPPASRMERQFEARIWNEIIMERNNSLANIYFNQLLDAWGRGYQKPAIMHPTYFQLTVISLLFFSQAGDWKWIGVAHAQPRIWRIHQTFGLWRLKRMAMKETFNCEPTVLLNMEDW